MYKIVYYWRIGTTPVCEGTRGAKKVYHAYVRCFGSKLFGDCVDRNNHNYSTLKEAQKACIKHFEDN